MTTATAQVLVNAALDVAGVARSDVHFVAVHGTGTPLGDPIEVGALGAALGTGRPLASQLVLGSNKVCIRPMVWRLLLIRATAMMRGCRDYSAEPEATDVQPLSAHHDLCQLNRAGMTRW